MELRRPYGLIIAALVCLGAAPSRTQTYTSGQVISPTAVTENEDNVFSYLQGGVDTYKTSSITSAAIGAGAVTSTGILDGTITTSDISSINGSVFATLSGIPSSAGVIPVANLSGLQSTLMNSSEAAGTTGAVAYTGAGFTPTAVIMFCVNNTTSNGVASWGMGDDANGENAVNSNSATATFVSQTAFLIDIQDGTNGKTGALTSMDTDGFTITYANIASGLAVACRAMAIR